MVTATRPPPSRFSALGALVSRHRVLLLVLAAHALFWALADQVISPHPDFIDHWVQSRVFSWGYYEHPPMIAWLIRALSWVYGNSEGGLEAMAITVNLTVILSMYALAVRTFGIRAGIFTLLGLEATVYFMGGTPMLQIEQPLMLSWIGGLAALLEYQRTGKSRWLVVMGVAAGLGALSKYTMVLFYLSGLVYVVLVPARRRDLRNPWLYAAGFISLLIFSPVIVWNAENDWFSFRYQLSKAGGPTEAFFGKHLIEFTVGYVLLFSPVLVLGGIVPVFRRLRKLGLTDHPETLLAVMGLVPTIFFSLAMIRGSFPDPKWANVGFLSFFLLLGPGLERLWEAGMRRRVRWLVGCALGLNLAIIVAVAVQTWHPYFVAPEGGDPTEQIVGWEKTGEQVEALLAAQHRQNPKYVISFLYPLASQFALHMPSHPLTHSLKRPQRNLWSPRRDMTLDNTIVVCSGRDCRWVKGLMEREIGWSLAPLGTVETRKWGVLRHKVEVLVPIPYDGPNAPPRR